MELTEKTCVPCEGGVKPLDASEVEKLMNDVPGWQVNSMNTEISRTFEFKGYYKTIAFVNAIAWMANQEVHHPDLEVSYNQCVVKYTTHAIAGLSENDFICAAKVNLLYKSSPT